jgi:hypothetical protein
VNAGLACEPRYASAASHPHTGDWTADGDAVGCTGGAGWGGAGSVVVVDDSAVVVVVGVGTADVVADRWFLDKEGDPRRAVKTMPDPAAALMRATPVTVSAIRGTRPSLSTDPGIGERRRLLETDGIAAPGLGEAAGQPLFSGCSGSGPALSCTPSGTSLERYEGVDPGAGVRGRRTSPLTRGQMVAPQAL